MEEDLLQQDSGACTVYSFGLSFMRLLGGAMLLFEAGQQVY